MYIHFKKAAAKIRKKSESLKVSKVGEFDKIQTGTPSPFQPMLALAVNHLLLQLTS
jgi:hypothetical protein